MSHGQSQTILPIIYRNWYEAKSCLYATLIRKKSRSSFHRRDYYSKALDSWEQAWQLLKNTDDPKGNPQADRAPEKLAWMYSKLGRMADLIDLLESVTSRSVTRSGAQLIHSEQEGLWLMQTFRVKTFRCLRDADKANSPHRCQQHECSFDFTPSSDSRWTAGACPCPIFSFESTGSVPERKLEEASGVGHLAELG
jgi:hypothetical protein